MGEARLGRKPREQRPESDTPAASQTGQGCAHQPETATSASNAISDVSASSGHQRHRDLTLVEQYVQHRVGKLFHMKHEVAWHLNICGTKPFQITVGKNQVQEQSMSVHASLFTWSQRVRRGPRLSQLGFSPRLPLLWCVWYCLEVEFGFLTVDIAPDLLELRFVYLFASRSTFYSTLLSSTPSLTSPESMGRPC